MARRPNMNLAAFIAVAMIGLLAASAITAPLQPVAAEPSEAMNGTTTVTWTFPGQPEESLDVTCDESGLNFNFCDVMFLTAQGDGEDQQDCQRDRESTGVVRVVGEIEGTSIDIELDRAVNCDRWLWDGRLASTLPLPPHLVVPQIAGGSGDFYGVLTVDGALVDEIAPLSAGLRDDQAFLNLNFCGLGFLGSVRVDAEGRWELPRGSGFDPECPENQLGRGSRFLTALFASEFLDVESSETSLVLGAATSEGNVELRFERSPARNPWPELIDSSYDETTRVLTWTAVDDGELPLWACVREGESGPPKCERGATSLVVPPSENSADGGRIRLRLTDEYGARHDSVVWAPPDQGVSDQDEDALADAPVNETGGVSLVVKLALAFIAAGVAAMFVRAWRSRSGVRAH